MNKKGFAIPLVLIFAAVLAVLGTFIFKNTTQYNTQNRTGLAQLQAHFVARAALQHAMLKVKFLHRELYDAACLSQGINPLFDFTNINYENPASSIKDYNPGPIFLYKSGQFSPSGLYTPDFAPPNDKGIWLKNFQEDIISGIEIPAGGTRYNWCMNLNPPPNNIKSLMREPFVGQYQITELKQAANETYEDTPPDSVVSNFAIIEMTVVSTINNAKNQNFSYTMKKTIKVTRDAM